MEAQALSRLNAGKGAEGGRQVIEAAGHSLEVLVSLADLGLPPESAG